MRNTEPALIQPVAFHLAHDPLPGGVVYTARMPASWRIKLLKLEEKRQEDRRSNAPVTLPIRSLNAALIALCPELLTVPGGADEDAKGVSKQWLFAREPFSLRPFSRLVQAWVAATYSDNPACSPLLTDIDKTLAEQPTWEPCEIGATGLAENEMTADPASLAYTVIPARLADLLVERETLITVQGKPEKLVRVPSSTGAELMTWPPTYYAKTDRQGRTWQGACSYTIHLTLQTLPGDRLPRIHIHYGVRRWVLNPLDLPAEVENGGQERRLYLPSTNTTVYLRTEFSWLANAPISVPLFTRASIFGRGGGDQRTAEWASKLDRIVKYRGAPWVKLDELVKNPQRFLDTPSQYGLQAGITVHQQPNYIIKTGIGFDDHERITKAIAETLGDVLHLVPALPRRLVSLRKSQAHPLEDDLLSLPQKQRQQGITTAVELAQPDNAPEQLVEIRWQTEEFRDRMVATIQHVLEDTSREQLWARTQEVASLTTQVALEGFDTDDMPRATPTQQAPVWSPPHAPDELTLDLAGGGRLHIVCRQVDELFAPFEEPVEKPRGAPGRVRYRKEEIQRRQAALFKRLSPPAMRRAAIIELPNYQDPQRRQLRHIFGLRDPKSAIRLAYARAGYVTKFCDPSPRAKQREIRTEKDLKAVRDQLYGHYYNTWLSLLNQLGAIPASLGYAVKGEDQLPETLLVAGVHILRLTRKRAFQPVKLPLVVLMRSNSQEVLAWLPDGKGVKSFAERLCDIACYNHERVKIPPRGQVDPNIMALVNFLTNDIFDEGIEDVVVLVNAQNVRGALTGMTNAAIVPDMIKLLRGDEDAIPVDMLRGRLRLIRLRTSTQRETPEWYEPDVPPGSGYRQGIWPLNDRLFYNISNKSATMKTNPKSKQDELDKRVALPSILEVFVAALPPEESPDRWARAVDQWRRFGHGIGTSDMLLFPLPLHYASLADGYAEVIGPWVLPVVDADPGENDSEPLDELEAGNAPSTSIHDGGEEEEVDEWEGFMMVPMS
ncbi:MAG: hypothetical protein OHK0022_07340 [Roseiflexaceae bacterium]